MRLHRMLLLAALALIVFPAAALGASSRLSLRAADRAADNTASDIADNWAADDGTAIDDYDLGDCTRVSRRKADCDITYTLDDGSECDDTIHVRMSVRGRVTTTSDSDDGDTQTFDSCTDPTADPTVDDGSTDDGSDQPAADASA